MPTYQFQYIEDGAVASTSDPMTLAAAEIAHEVASVAAAERAAEMVKLQRAGLVIVRALNEQRDEIASAWVQWGIAEKPLPTGSIVDGDSYWILP